MKHLLLAATSMGFLLSAAAQETQGPDKKASYIIGHQIGSNLARDGAPIDLAELTRGMKTALEGKALGLTKEEASATMNAFAQRVTNAKKQKAKGFTDSFAKQKGVKTTASGLMYKVLVAGKGESPKSSDKVKVNYRGTLTNGTEFDSSYKRGKPAEFQVGGVIKGWTEALQLMKPGGKWKLVIPSELAYGPRGAGRMIGPNETLVFEVELLEIVQ